MKIAIYGAGKAGEYVVQQIRESKESKLEVVWFIDNNPDYLGKSKYGVSIVNLECFMKAYRNTAEGILIAALDEMTVQKMAVSLLNHSYGNIYILPSNVLTGTLPVLNSSGEFISYIKHISTCKPVLPYVEYHVSDYCNLKCKRCGHFSNIVTEKVFPDMEEFRAELKGLSKRFRNIRQFRLMGGEPFINPDLKSFVCEVRREFPYADIRVVSNGLLLPNVSAQTLEAIRKCGATIDISQYPPTRKIMENLIRFAQEKELKIQVGKEITQFFKGISSDVSTEYEKIYSKCVSKTCHFLRKGRLYVCGAPILFFENKDFLELDITDEDVKNNSFDLIEGYEDGWEILKKLLSPFDFCRHCTYAQWYDWQVSGENVDKGDWIVSEAER